MGRGERGLRLVLCFSARDKTGGLGLEEQREEICGQPTWVSGRDGLWFIRGCLLDTEAKEE